MHRHVWKIVEKTEQPAPVELSGPGLQFEARAGDGLAMFRRSVIVTRRCERCGTEEVLRA